MKQYVKEFLKRGLLCAAGGPIVMAVIYGILGITGTVDTLSPTVVCTDLLSVTLMAFIAAGITMVYQIEQLPLLSAILIHGGVLYLDYLLLYFVNSWIPQDWASIGFFTLIFFASYALTWLCIYASIRIKTNQINKKLPK